MTDATDAPEALEDREQVGRGSAAEVRLWLAAIDASGREEKSWRDDAERAYATYRAAKSEQDKGRRFNILYANADTLVPALYNTVPVPDVRRRYGEDDPVAAVAARVIERALSLGSDEYDFDGELEALAYDAYLAGRGVVRVRYTPWKNDVGEVVYERAECEHVAWDTFRRGPARRWQDVPWVAFRHELTRDELRKLAPQIADRVQLDAKDKHAPDEDGETGELFMRACVWEVWDREKRRVQFVATGYKDAPLATMDDPLALEGFFPCPEPVMFVRVPGSLVPVCPYRLYEDQAEELNRISARISALVKVIKWRGLYADSGLGASMTALDEAEDGELVPAEGLAAMADGGGLDKHVWLMPVEQAANVLRELVQQRELIKATIYEITGISDILRGASKANETATAQGIKAQWGSLRLQRMQKAMAKAARDVLRLKAEIIAERFSPQTLSLLLGSQVPPEAMQLLRDQKTRGFRIDIETDSTIKADLSRAQQEYSSFLTGLGGLLQSALPVVQADPSMRPVLITLIKSGARMFRLGRQAEEAIDAIPEQPPQQQGDPNAAGQAETQAKVQAEQVKLQGQQQIEAMRIQAEDRRHAATLDLEREKIGAQQATARQTKAAPAVGLNLSEQAEATMASAMQQSAQAAVVSAQAAQQGAQAMAAAAEQMQGVARMMAAPRQIVRGPDGRAIGVKPVMEG